MGEEREGKCGWLRDTILGSWQIYGEGKKEAKGVNGVQAWLMLHTAGAAELCFVRWPSRGTSCRELKNREAESLGRLPPVPLPRGDKENADYEQIHRQRFS